jgi:hypothetical protein
MEDFCKEIRVAAGQETEVTVIVGAIVPAAAQFNASIGPGIQLVIEEELREKTVPGNILVSKPGPRGAFAIEGKYRVVSRRVPGQAEVEEVDGFVLDLWLTDRQGKELLRQQITLDADRNPGGFAGFVAWATGCDFDPPRNRSAQVSKILWGNGRVWLVSSGEPDWANAAAVPVTATNGSTDFGLEIQVKKTSVDESQEATYEQRPFREEAGQRCVALDLHDVFRVVLLNYTESEAVAELTLDGVNSMAFSNNWNAAKDGRQHLSLFLIPAASAGTPGQTIVTGWMRTNEYSDEFAVVEEGRGAAGQLGYNTGDVGLITARFARTLRRSTSMIEQSTGIGTEIGRGSLIRADYTTVQRYIDGNWTLVSVRYQRPKVTANRSAK